MEGQHPQTLEVTTPEGITAVRSRLEAQGSKYQPCGCTVRKLMYQLACLACAVPHGRRVGGRGAGVGRPDAAPAGWSGYRVRVCSWHVW